MEKLLKRHTISFQNAWAGIWWALTTQPNFRVHIALSFLVLLLAWAFSLSTLECIILVFTIILGLTAEMINTALEAMTDLITKEWRKEAKIAKDVAAGMMLTVAIGAIGIALLLFGPRIAALIR